MPDFEHFILTRFNIRQGAVPASESWLRHRLHYFEALCLPSITGQTSQNFRWLVFLDGDREPWFQAEIDRLSEGIFTPVWLEGGGISPQGIADHVAQLAVSPWIITSRVDNDDAIARDYVEVTQSQFERQAFEFINFQSGVQFSKDGFLYSRSDPASPFISLIEKREDGLRGVYVGRHDKIADYGPIRQVHAHPMWLQMVHDLNLGNALVGIQADPSLLRQHFTVNLEAAPVSKLALRAGQAKNLASLAVHVLRKPHRIAWAFRVALNRVVRQGA
ncbi:glycosyltransferase [Arthrobacter sp. NicSoilC5]|uniref:glycosyltransferase n=1 Tax=Arthrobacter sp. NicSoilC5 TaxID=2831000 RepID=UPI001CC40084|nr:glycosyltransferase [Arthrobacter sp. NicSoilC5]BCW79803.1 hypothetical protein NicSoilC5_18220 [Arthrobacter sp. NicSoilC5]